LRSLEPSEWLPESATLVREEVMHWSNLARGGFVAVTLCCFGLPQAEAVEIFFDGPEPCGPFE
jgi:hypothetical protein